MPRTKTVSWTLTGHEREHGLNIYKISTTLGGLFLASSFLVNSKLKFKGWNFIKGLHLRKIIFKQKDKGLI
tara:strand:+ start:10390 stop:10602 length:213 start_codon:yes stop_codon:yes gene_type:complete